MSKTPFTCYRCRLPILFGESMSIGYGPTCHKDYDVCIDRLRATNELLKNAVGNLVDALEKLDWGENEFKVGDMVREKISGRVGHIIDVKGPFVKVNIYGGFIPRHKNSLELINKGNRHEDLRTTRADGENGL